MAYPCKDLACGIPYTASILSLPLELESGITFCLSGKLISRPCRSSECGSQVSRRPLVTENRERPREAASADSITASDVTRTADAIPIPHPRFPALSFDVLMQRIFDLREHP